MAKNHPIPSHSRFQDLTGRTFGRWIVLSYAGKTGTTQYWLCRCRCRCGTVRKVQSGDLVAGKSLSCGCFKRERTSQTMRIHGMSDTPEFRTWESMIARCYKPNRHDYPRYGGRRITVCDQWRESFAAFYADMGPRPSANHSIDRVDNDGPYCPENCRWATRKQQSRNMRSNLLITFQGETLCLTDWAEKLGVSLTALKHRVARGWSNKRTLTQPVRGQAIAK